MSFDTIPYLTQKPEVRPTLGSRAGKAARSTVGPSLLLLGGKREWMARGQSSNANQPGTTILLTFIEM